MILWRGRQQDLSEYSEGNATSPPVDADLINAKSPDVAVFSDKATVQRVQTYLPLRSFGYSIVSDDLSLEPLASRDAMIEKDGIYCARSANVAARHVLRAMRPFIRSTGWVRQRTCRRH
jgi:hypothetical protein